MRPYRLSGDLGGQSALVLASPHSGQWFPPAFLAEARLPVSALRRLEDAHIGALLRESASQGLPLLEATHARAVIDLNRAADEYDPSMIAGQLALPAAVSERVRRGYGLFPRLAGTGQPIHGARIPAAILQARIEALHRPWHLALESGLADAARSHGHAVLLDMHSMPSLEGFRPAQLVLGDRRGTSAAPALVNWLDEAFAAEGLMVARNDPYAGGYTTERHGRPMDGLHAVQMEFDRALYMDPATLKPHAGFDRLGAMLARVLGRLAEALPSLGLGPESALPLAAE